MREPEWILRETVLALHEQLLGEFGGAEGIRDEGLLDSALSRPRNRFAYGNPRLSDIAAAYAFGLIKNHPFADGNKRIGFAVAAIFLQLNGRELAAEEVDAVVKTLALAAGDIGERKFANWLEANSHKL